MRDYPPTACHVTQNILPSEWSKLKYSGDLNCDRTSDIDIRSSSRCVKNFEVTSYDIPI